MQNFQTVGFVDDTPHVSKILRSFLFSPCEMQKIPKQTHNITSKMRNNVSFQLYAPEDEKIGNLSTLLKPTDSCAGLAQKCVLMALSNHSCKWDKNAIPHCCSSFFLTPTTGKFYVELLTLEDMRCFGLKSISGLGSFFATESSGDSGCDRLRGAAYILTEDQSLFVPCWFLPVIISLQAKDNVDKGALLHKVHCSDVNRHMLHKLDKQAILYFVNVFAQSDLTKTWLEIRTGMEGWLSSW